MHAPPSRCEERFLSGIPRAQVNPWVLAQLPSRQGRHGIPELLKELSANGWALWSLPSPGATRVSESVQNGPEASTAGLQNVVGVGEEKFKGAESLEAHCVVYRRALVGILE